MSHVGGEDAGGSYGLCCVGDFRRITAVGMGVGLDVGGVGDAGLEEIEFEFQLAGLPSIHGADGPLVTGATGDGDEFFHLAV